MAQEEDYAKGFIKGFQEGLEAAWDEIIKLSTKGYTSRELQIMAKTKKSMLYQKVQQKADELERATGRKIFVQDVVGPPPLKPQVQFIPGWSYLVKEGRPERSFAMFVAILSQGGKGLCISRTHPDVLKQKYGFDAESLWLTKTERSERVCEAFGARVRIAQQPRPPGIRHTRVPREGREGSGHNRGARVPEHAERFQERAQVRAADKRAGRARQRLPDHPGGRGDHGCEGLLARRARDEPSPVTGVADVEEDAEPTL